jgi:hypothetical protein
MSVWKHKNSQTRVVHAGNMKDNKISSNPAAQTSKGGWKSVLARVADQVSMVTFQSYKKHVSRVSVSL